MNQSSTLSGYRAEALHLAAGEKVSVSIEGSAIIFVEKGKITPLFDHIPQHSIVKGQLFFLPQGILCTLDSSREKSKVLVIQIPDIALLCFRFFPGITFKKTCLPGSFYHPLKAGKYLLDCMGAMADYIVDHKMDQLITEIKTLELFHLIKTTYSDDCIAGLFSSVDENDYRFVQFVFDNYRLVKNMEELARLSPYSLSGFEKQFRRIFGIAPYRWMLKQKTESIYKEIYDTSKPLKLIAEEFGFTGLAQLGTFCNRHLGFSPKVIRGKYEK